MRLSGEPDKESGHTEPGTRRLPTLSLLQRFAVTSFVVIAILGGLIAFFLDQSIEATALDSARQTAYDTLHQQLLQHISPRDLTAPMSGARLRTFQRFLGESVLSGRTVRVKMWSRSGRVVYSTDRRILGKTFPIKDELAEALRGRLASEVSNLTASENRDDRRFGKLLEVYIPIRFAPHQPVVGAFEIYQTYTPVARQIAGTQRSVYLLLGGGLCLLYLLLFGIVRSGSTTIARQQRVLRHYTRELESSYDQTIASLAAAVDARDQSTEQHSVRVTELAVALGRWLNLPEDELRDLERGAMLHDVGKIGISDTILLKPSELTEEEWEEMRRHPEIGHHMLQAVAFLNRSLPVVLHHHERWDGSGYPDGLCGPEIPLHARLFAVTDAYDAITSDRPYRKGAPREVAIGKLRQGAGTHFDPELVEAFVAMLEAHHAQHEDPNLARPA